MGNASTQLDVPLPKFAEAVPKYRTGLYSKRDVSDFLDRVIGQLEEALAAQHDDAKPPISAEIRAKLAALPTRDVRVSAFVEEALLCFDMGCFRAAVVLAWCGAIALLQLHVISDHLAEFNTEALRRDARWRAAHAAEDLGRLREVEFLQILETVNVITKSVRTELESGLKLRNSCGHPTELQVSEARTAAHLESLLLNVFSRFSLAG
jgi:hypothetical protein